MSNTKDILIKLIDDLPETKAGQAIEYLHFLKERSDIELYLSEKEEKEIWKKIETEERIESDEVKRLINGQ